MAGIGNALSGIGDVVAGVPVASPGRGFNDGEQSFASPITAFIAFELIGLVMKDVPPRKA